MKSSLMGLLAVGSIYLASCANNSNTTEAETKDSSSTVASTSSTSAPQSTNENDISANVPQPARTNFESRYPQANNVKWVHYENNEVDPTDWNYDWMSSMDTSDYQVNFNWEGMDYVAWYDNGEWMGSSARMTDNSKLPKSVNDAIHEKYSDYTITEVEKQNDKNRTVYEVEMEKGKDKLKLHYDENGNVLKAKGKVDGKKVKAKEDTK